MIRTCPIYSKKEIDYETQITLNDPKNKLDILKWISIYQVHCIEHVLRDLLVFENN